MAHAQDNQPPGGLVTLNVEQRFEASDNPNFVADGESNFTSQTVLGLGFASVRSIDSFNLNIGANIEGEDTFDTTRVFGALGYTRETRSARAAANLSFSENDIRGSVSDLEFDEDGSLILQSTGTRRNTRIGLEGAVGREAPLGASFSLGYNDVSYTGTAAQNQQDSTTVSFNGQVDFRITPRITKSLVSSYSYFDSQGTGVDRESLSLGFALSLEASETDAINLSVRQSRVKRTGTQVGTDEGLSLNFNWAHAVPNGSFAVNIGSEVSTNADGRRSTFRIQRALELPRGSLFVAFGITRTATGGTDPLLEMNYSHQMPNATLSAGLRQTVNTTNSNDEELNTRLRASYNQKLNALSSLDVSLSVFDRMGLSGGVVDAQRVDVQMAYRRELTNDWGLVGGYSHRFSAESGRSDIRSNTVFLGVERSFSWLP